MQKMMTEETYRDPRGDDEFRVKNPEALSLRKLMRAIPGQLIFTRSEIVLAERSVRQLVKDGVIIPLTEGCPEQTPATVDEIVADVVAGLPGSVQIARALCQLIAEPTSMSPKAMQNPATIPMYLRPALAALPQCAAAIPPLVVHAESPHHVGNFSRNGLKSIAHLCGEGSEAAIGKATEWLDATAPSRLDARTTLPKHSLEMRKLGFELLASYARNTGDRNVEKMIYKHSLSDPSPEIQAMCSDFIFEILRPEPTGKATTKKPATK